MGMFDMVLSSVPVECSRCKTWNLRWAQYSFGDNAMRSRHVGEIIVWDDYDPDQGERGHHLVGIEGGSADSCPQCGYHDMDLEFDIVIRDDVIESVVPSRGEIDYTSQGNYYWVNLEAPWKGKDP